MANRTTGPDERAAPLWRRPAVHDLLIVAVTACASAIAIFRYNIGDRATNWFRRFRPWEMDEVFLSGIVLVVLILWFGWRRRRDALRWLAQARAVEKDLLRHQEMMRELAHQLSIVEERERRQLAAELHDRIGQTLAVSKMKLSALRESVSDPLTVERITEIIGFVDQAVGKARTLMLDLSPPILYELGFLAAVEWLLERIRDQHGIEFEYVKRCDRKELKDDSRAFLFRIVRELLMNVVKHARAKKVTVTIRTIDGWLGIDIEDDGRGFDIATLAPDRVSEHGFGIFNIRERVTHLGGLINIRSGVDAGTRVSIELPLEE